MIKLIGLVVLLTGCASAVGWGQKYEVLHKNSKTITVKYDSVLADVKDFGPELDAHCAQYGKEAVPNRRVDSQAEGPYGGIQTVTYLCE